MRVDVTMPQLGETVSEGRLTRWFKSPGARVVAGEPLFEVATDTAGTEVAAPATGELSEILVEADRTVPVGARLAVISTLRDARAAGAPDRRPSPAGPNPRPGPNPKPAARPGPADGSGGPRRSLSPLVRRMLFERGLAPEEVAGTGPGGRITRADIDAAAAARTPASPPVHTAHSVDRVDRAEPAHPAWGTVTRVPFTAVRQLAGEHMVRSKATAPHALMAIEVDYSNVNAVRAQVWQEWRAAEGFSLTYLPFVARAVIDALAEHPHLNAAVGDGELLVSSRVHLGVTVDLDADGLVVPVIRDAGDRRLRGLARAVSELASLARGRALTADDLAGGTFTISNPGPYGTLLTGAIIHQPQVAILASDAVRLRPVAMAQPDGAHAIAVHPIGNLSLSFDHRAVDGAYAARFLSRVREILEGREWSAEL